MRLFDEVRKLGRYLIRKRDELEALDVKDAVMAKVILDIHRKKARKRVVSVPLFELRQIHTLDRDSAREATAQRIKALQRCESELLEAGTLTCELLAHHLPSVSWIKVVQESEHAYLAFEGNGRIAAMQAVFSPADEMRVEVELYEFRNPTKVIRGLNRVRRLNGLLEQPARDRTVA